ncbi:MAG: glycosyltransferase family 4 protein [Vicinamibacterales bacterium]|nr:glycosyltransferase family 4 protein [Vicinamibacterales bacterium]
MNVLFVNATRTWGGVKTWMVELASFLGRRGHGVTVACRPGNLLQAACVDRGLACDVLRFGSDYSPVTIARFVRLMRRRRADVIVTNVSKDIRTAGVAARLCGVAHVNRLGGFSDIDDRVRTRLVYNALVDRVIVPSHGLLEHYARFPFLRGKLRRFPNAVVPQTRPERRPGPVRIAVLARLSRRKRVDLVLRACSSLRELPWELHVGGSGPELVSLVRLASDLAIADRVSFACEGAEEFTKVDGPSFLRDKDIGILVSDSEPFAWAILEYMASSCAVIASAVDGPLELIRDGVNGLLVAPGSHDALAAAVRSLIEHPERRESLAKHGYETVCREYHQDLVFPLVEADLLDVVSAHRRRHTRGAARSAS